MAVNMQNGTWSVVAQVSDPEMLIRSFVSYYLDLGASEVFLFFDHPNPVLQAELADLERVQVFENSLDLFQDIHGRSGLPKKKTFRQALNATYASKLTRSDWILHVDVDEFLCLNGDLGAELRDAPDDLGYFEVSNLERRFAAGARQNSIFEGLTVDPAKYQGPEDPMLHRGCLGHVAGKPLVRTGAGYHIAVHRAKIGKPMDRQFPPSQTLQSGRLIHFDGMTPFHWAVKLLRRASMGLDLLEQMYSGPRLLQIFEVFARAADRDQLIALYRSFDITDTSPAWIEPIKPIKFNDGSQEGAIDDSPTKFDEAIEVYYQSALVDLEKQPINWRVLADDLRL